MSRHKLDIFRTLGAMDKRDSEFYNKLTDEERKGYHPPVVLRWASAAKGADAHEFYLAATNRMNLHFYDVYDHPELQWRLTAKCGAGMPVKHDWIPNPKGKMSKLFQCLSTYYPEANKFELEVIMGKFDENSFSDFIDGTGMNLDDAKTIKKLFKEHRG